MKSFALFAAAVAMSLTLTVSDAEAAKRFGGGSSVGMQRQAVTPQKTAPTTTPTQNTAPQNAAAAPTAANPATAAPAAAQPKRSWMGPVAGLAAGLGLAALASHFGFGEELASMMMIGLLVLAVLMVVGFIMRKKAAAQQPALAGAGAGNLQYAGGDFNRAPRAEPQYPQGGMAAAAQPAAASTAPAGNIPADFDTAAFVRNAKVNFIRLQAAHDRGDLEDIREFTSPEVFAEIKMNLGERAGASQQTDVVSLEAEVLDVAEEASRYVVSVRFNGLIREEAEDAAQPFDEIWHLTKPVDGSRGWVVAGIQQVQ